MSAAYVALNESNFRHWNEIFAVLKIVTFTLCGFAPNEGNLLFNASVPLAAISVIW